jgi:hypothetical protein
MEFTQLFNISAKKDGFTNLRDRHSTNVDFGKGRSFAVRSDLRSIVGSQLERKLHLKFWGYRKCASIAGEIFLFFSRKLW